MSEELSDAELLRQINYYRAQPANDIFLMKLRPLELEWQLRNERKNSRYMFGSVIAAAISAIGSWLAAIISLIAVIYSK